jgi:hypothetical protein
MSAEGALLFALAGISSCCGALVTNPFDVARVRLQVAGERGGQLRALLATTAALCREPLRTGAFRGLHLSFAREASYSGVRIGSYEPFRRALEGTALGAGLASKLLAGAAAGVIGAVVGQPFDLLKTRVMGLPGPPPPALAMAADVAGRGAAALFTTGLLPSAQRAGVITAAQLGTYGQAKGLLRDRAGLREGPALHVAASCCAGLAATLASSPLDVAKTRIMAGSLEAGAPPAGGTLRAMAGIAAREGAAALFKGFPPSYARLALHTTTTLTVFEALRGWARVAPL